MLVTDVFKLPSGSVAVSVDLSDGELIAREAVIKLGDTLMCISELGSRCHCIPPRSYNLILTHISGPERDPVLGDVVCMDS